MSTYVKPFPRKRKYVTFWNLTEPFNLPNLSETLQFTEPYERFKGFSFWNFETFWNLTEPFGTLQLTEPSERFQRFQFLKPWNFSEPYRNLPEADFAPFRGVQDTNRRAKIASNSIGIASRDKKQCHVPFFTCLNFLQCFSSAGFTKLIREQITFRFRKRLSL